MTKTADITIIGAGIIGLLTARELMMSGATVTIIEKNQVGQESSWAGGGILLPLYPWRQNDAISVLVTQSLQMYPALSAQLTDDTGIDPEWTACGLLILKNPDIKAAETWCDRHSIRFEQADEHLLRPFNTDATYPLWLPDIAQARNPRLLKSLKQDLVNRGANIQENCKLTGIVVQGNRVKTLKTTLGSVSVAELIISAGAWTGDLFQQFFPYLNGSTPRIVPVKGQMLLFEATREILPFMVLAGDHYLIPRRDGKILVGSSVEHDHFNKTPTENIRHHLTEFAVTLLPSLQQFPIIYHWAGLRPGTQHGIPYIDRHPTLTNLYINAGHFRNGLAMGPASARLLADLLLNRAPQISPEPFRLASLH